MGSEIEVPGRRLLLLRPLSGLAHLLAQRLGGLDVHLARVEIDDVSLTDLRGQLGARPLHLLAVDDQDGQLFLTPAVQGVAVDGAGYPLALDPARVFVH